jgi:hypothetical protein
MIYLVLGLPFIAAGGYAIWSDRNELTVESVVWNISMVIAFLMVIFSIVQ